MSQTTITNRIPTPVPVKLGGTAADLSATGGTSEVLKQVSAGAAITVAQLAASDLSNGTTGMGAVVLSNAPQFDNNAYVQGARPAYAMVGTEYLAKTWEIMEGAGTLYIHDTTDSADVLALTGGAGVGYADVLTGFKVNGTPLAASNLSNGVTGTGAVVLATSPSISTIYGGTAAGSTLTLEGTSSGSPASAFLLLNPNGQYVGIGTATPLSPLHVHAGTDANLRVIPGTALGLSGGPAFHIYNDANTLLEPLGFNALEFDFLAGGLTVGSPTGGSKGNGTINVSSNYYVGGSQIAASNLSNGTTGTGNVVLATEPNIVTSLYLGTTGAGTGCRLFPNGPDTVAGVKGTLVEFINPSTGVDVAMDNSGNMGVGGYVSAYSGYKVNGTPLAASNLSNGVTGTGAVVLANTPVFPNNTFLSWTDDGATTRAVLGTDQYGTVNLNGYHGRLGILFENAANYFYDGTSGNNIAMKLGDSASSEPSSATVISGYTYSARGTTGVSGGPYTGAQITNITTVGGIVTVLSNVSDERLKDAVPFGTGLDAILAINPIKYTWNEKGQKHVGIDGGVEHVGFSAQNVGAAIPEAIAGTEIAKDGSGEIYFGLDREPILCALVNAVKELSARVKELESG